MINFDKNEALDIESIQLFEISSRATYIASVINNKLYIKVLNSNKNTQDHNNLAYQQSIPFMPMYLDEDYNYQINKNRWESYYKNKKKGSSSDDQLVDTPEISYKEV